MFAGEESFECPELELGVSQALVKSSLFRTRKKLKDYLEKEGITL